MGIFKETAIMGNYKLINEELVGRTSGEQITIFKTVGSAVLDVVVATEIVKKAKENNLGKLIY